MIRLFHKWILELYIMNQKEINLSLFKQFNLKLLLSIILFTLIPTIYKTTRIFFIGSIDDGYSYSIASQIQLLNILYEILTEAIVVPCFFVLSSIKINFDNKTNCSESKQVITILSLVVTTLFLLFSLIISATIEPLLNSVNNDPILVEKSLN